MFEVTILMSFERCTSLVNPIQDIGHFYHPLKFLWMCRYEKSGEHYAMSSELGKGVSSLVWLAPLLFFISFYSIFPFENTWKFISRWIFGPKQEVDFVSRPVQQGKASFWGKLCDSDPLAVKACLGVHSSFHLGFLGSFVRFSRLTITWFYRHNN